MQSLALGLGAVCAVACGTPDAEANGACRDCVDDAGAPSGTSAPCDRRPFLADAKLRAAVRTAAGLKNDYYAPEDVLEVSQITAGKAGIRDLTGVQCLVGLEVLSVPDNSVASLAPLRQMPHLRLLDASGNRITDIAPLAGAKDLRWLKLARNRIASVGALAGLTELDEIDLTGNEIRDPSPLAENEGIGPGDHVQLRDNPIDCETAAAELTALDAREVYLAHDCAAE